VSVGVEKLTGAGARPGLILTGPVEARIRKLEVGKSKTVTSRSRFPQRRRGATSARAPTTSGLRSTRARRRPCALAAPAATSRSPISRSHRGETTSWDTAVSRAKMRERGARERTRFCLLVGSGGWASRSLSCVTNRIEWCRARCEA
jgi:hypothetical protein